jgi:hypothetical protein
MSIRIVCVLGLLAAALLPGCITKPAQQQPVAYRTGSMVPVPKSDLSKPTADPTQSVSQDQLLQTGRVDPAAALKSLVPQAH